MSDEVVQVHRELHNAWDAFDESLEANGGSHAGCEVAETLYFELAKALETMTIPRDQKESDALICEAIQKEIESGILPLPPAQIAGEAARRIRQQ